MKKLLSIIVIAVLLLSFSMISQITNAHFVSASTSSSSYFTYKVKRGDTLSKIAKEHQTTVTTLQKLNHLTTMSLKINQSLKIPTTAIKPPTINKFLPVISSNKSNYILSGKGEINAYIYFVLSDSAKNTISVTLKTDTKGNFSKGVDLSNLKDGFLSVSYYQKSSKGVKSSVVQTSITKDTLSPAISLTANNISSLNKTNYFISGKAEKNYSALLTISDGIHQPIIQAVKTNYTGYFSSIVNTQILSDGKITIKVLAKDVFGNSNTSVYSVTKDTIAPNVTLDVLDITSNNQISYSISGKTEGNSSIILSFIDGSHPALTKSIKSNDEGNFNSTFDLHSLNDGKITVKIVANDSFGNTFSSQVSIIKDTNGADVSIQTSDVTINNQLNYTLKGSTEPNVSVNLSINDGTHTPFIKTVTSDATGNFSSLFDLHTLNDGTLTINVTTKDSGNNSKTTIFSIKKMTTQPEPTPPVLNGDIYTLDAITMAKWGIFNDGTHPVETTKGINDALTFAHDNGYTTFKVPAGTYLISKGSGAWYDKSSYITMPSNMMLLLDDNAIIQKETNSFTGYKTLVIPMFVENVTIKGGTFRGDKDTHNYYDGAVKWVANKTYKTGDKVISTNTVADSSGYYYVATNDGTSGTKEPSWSNVNNTTDNSVIWKPVARNTNEGGYGIITSGAYNVTIDGVKSTNFTGDGLAIGGDRAYSSGAGANSFESGSIDDNGIKIPDDTKIRMKGYFNVTDPSFNITHNFVIDMIRGVPQTFDVYFYKADGSFLSKSDNQSRGYYVAIPDGAAKFALVFVGTVNSNINMEFHNKIQSHNVLVQNSEFSFNRRQGITVGGGDNVLIINNEIHDIKGTMPQAGIDVEGGFWEDGTLNTNINIKSNNLYNNAKYDIVLYDGNTALVEGNKIHAFSDHGAVGLSIPSPFTNATVKNNDFYNTSIYAYHDVHFIGNTFKYSYTYLEGPNVSIDGMNFIYARFNLNATKPYGISVKNVSLDGSSIGIWNQPVQFDNVTASEYFSFDATSKIPEGTIFNNLKVDGILFGSLGNVTYNNCSFQNTTGWSNTLALIDKPGKYVFNNCSFGGTKFSGMKIASSDADVTINNSVLDSPLDVSAILVEKAKSIDIENTSIKSNAGIGTQKSVVMIGDDWTNSNPFTISSVKLNGNTITSNSSVNGISTVFSGLNAPSYNFTNNILYNGKLNLKTNDISQNNQLLTK